MKFPSNCRQFLYMCTLIIATLHVTHLAEHAQDLELHMHALSHSRAIIEVRGCCNVVI